MFQWLTSRSQFLSVAVTTVVAAGGLAGRNGTANAVDAIYDDVDWQIQDRVTTAATDSKSSVWSKNVNITLYENLAEMLSGSRQYKM